MHDIAFYRSRWHGLPVENGDRAFEVFDACTHDKGYYLEYPGEEEMCIDLKSTAPAIQFTRPKPQGRRSACMTPNPETQHHLYDLQKISGLHTSLVVNRPACFWLVNSGTVVSPRRDAPVTLA